jgi:hypothetical protein
MFWQKTQSQQWAAQKAAEEKDESKPRYLRLILSDFVLSHTFDGWEFDDVEPRHRLAVAAKWRHHWNSEKIFFNGHEIDPEETSIWFSGVGNSKTKTDRSRATYQSLYVYLTDTVFEQLVDTVKYGHIKEAQLFMNTEPRPDHGPRLVLGDSSLQITSQPPKVPLPPTNVVNVPALIKRATWQFLCCHWAARRNPFLASPLIPGSG